MRTRQALLSLFAQEARAVGVRFGVHVTTYYDPENDAGPFCCYYQRPSGTSVATPADYTPEDAVENLETAICQALSDLTCFFTAN